MSSALIAAQVARLDINQFRAAHARLVPGVVMLFEMGRDWEAYYDDASAVGGALGIEVTAERSYSGDVVATASIPNNELEAVCRRLYVAGYRAQLCRKN